MNLAIHLFAALAFTIMVFLYIQKTREKKLLKAYLAGELRRKVSVDWPLSFLVSFARAMEIPLAGRWKKGDGPHRLQKHVLFDTLLLYGIDGIKYEENYEKNGETCVVFRLARRIPSVDALESELSDALQIKVRVISTIVFEKKNLWRGPFLKKSSPPRLPPKNFRY
ncbi:MAG: hypothetical protein HYW48_08570 [Deltaproteobacteria bacterium]|nr:hypothetical protein [Deltaproteobacteria bacterium]